MNAETSLPPGWRVEEVKRPKGNHIDRYWYSPHCQYKFRSRVQMKKYLDVYCSEEFQCFEDSTEKERAVWQVVFPNKRTARVSA